jgi:hypothetical protein
MLMRGCGAWAVGLCESIRLGEGRSRPGLRVLRETAFNKVKLSYTSSPAHDWPSRERAVTRAARPAPQQYPKVISSMSSAPSSNSIITFCIFCASQVNERRGQRPRHREQARRELEPAARRNAGTACSA